MRKASGVLGYDELEIDAPDFVTNCELTDRAIEQLFSSSARSGSTPNTSEKTEFTISEGPTTVILEKNQFCLCK
jgi:hypothetical protein